MSEPVTNVELEDVLTSIRRMVAEVPRPQTSFPTGRDPLLLTPDQRVHDVPEQAVGSAPLLLHPAMAHAGASVANGAGAPSTLSRDGDSELAGRIEDIVIARLAARIEVAMTDDETEFEPDGSEDAAVVDWDSLQPDETPIFRSRQGASTRLFDVAGPNGTDFIAPDDHEGEIPAIFHHRAPAAHAPAQQASASETSESTTPVPQVIAQFAPVPPVRGPGPGRQTVVDVAPSALPADPSATSQDLVLDEAVLRDLVAEVVRQELQGPLGERMTRNIRKLVRREVHRALAGHDVG